MQTNIIFTLRLSIIWFVLLANMKVKTFSIAVLAAVFSATLAVPFFTNSVSTTNGPTLVTACDGSQAVKRQALHSRAVALSATCTKDHIRQITKILSWCQRLAIGAIDVAELAVHNLPEGRRNT